MLILTLLPFIVFGEIVLVNQFEDITVSRYSDFSLLLKAKYFDTDSETPIILDIDDSTLPSGFRYERVEETFGSCPTGLVDMTMSHEGKYLHIGTDGMVTYNITDLENPVDVGNAGAPFATRESSQIERLDKTLALIVSTGQCKVVDVTDPSTPYVTTSITYGSRPEFGSTGCGNCQGGLYSTEEHVYIRASTYLAIYDPDSDFSSELGSVDFGYSAYTSVYVNPEEDLLFANGDGGGNRFSIANVTDKNNPVLIGTYDLGTKGPVCGNGYGDVVFASGYSDHGEPGLVVKAINVSDPETPNVISEIPGFLSLYNLRMVGRRLYVVDYYYGLFIYDVLYDDGAYVGVDFLSSISVGSTHRRVLTSKYFLAVGLTTGATLLSMGDILFEGIPPDCGEFEIRVLASDGFQEKPFNTTFKLSVVGTSEGYVDTYCTIFPCDDGTLSNETDKVCSGGKGVCVKETSTFGEYKCNCIQGYYSTEEDDPFANCGDFYCSGYHKDDSNACSGKGTCVSSETCSCFVDYDGPNCDVYYCYDYESTDHSNVCSSRGTCVEPDTCDCDSMYKGDECDVNLITFTIVVPLATVGGGLVGMVIIISIFLTICLVFIFFLALVLCLVCLCAGSCALVIRVSSQRLRLKKFGKIRDIDLIMKEQELEKETDIAHLRINKSLFKVDYNEIEITKILGEGGSNSVVYQAKWRKREVAFKAFKTLNLFRSQHSFSEFEREVEVLSSVSHPSVISFFGACLNPPRVGILMEFCEKGDLDVFLGSYEEENGEVYPLREKIRMCFEINSSIDYIHSRNIIHRDLKLENVLVDKLESCKLMDFGLSRIMEHMDVEKTVRVGTSCFMAPEICTTSNYDEKCDVFSFGIMLWIIFSENRHPYGDQMEMGIEMRVANTGLRPDANALDVLDQKAFNPDMCFMEREGKLIHIFIRQLKKMVVRAWDERPEKRPSTSELDEFFSEWLKKTELDDNAIEDDGIEDKGEEDCERSGSVDDVGINEDSLEEKVKYLERMKDRVIEFCEENDIDFSQFLK